MIRTLTRNLLAVAAFSTAVSVSAADDYTKELYDLYCTACHAVKASGAPQAFTREWDDRMDQGIDVLVNHAINGIRNMPPMGTCAECSEEDLENIIRYMAKQEL
ncbi:c-type cytochrome [Thalassolituus sp. LLYu03]|uniref:c-type cytochrome n=1 Tax=Thalassolituus sp. LLYu03 TaxID=3421656 RepID=UPI003D2D10A8